MGATFAPDRDKVLSGLLTSAFRLNFPNANTAEVLGITPSIDLYRHRTLKEGQYRYLYAAEFIIGCLVLGITFERGMRGEINTTSRVAIDRREALASLAVKIPKVQRAISESTIDILSGSSNHELKELGLKKSSYTSLMLLSRKISPGEILVVSNLLNRSVDDFLQKIGEIDERLLGVFD